jgi:hypothetical protein
LEKAKEDLEAAKINFQHHHRHRRFLQNIPRILHRFKRENMINNILKMP